VILLGVDINKVSNEELFDLINDLSREIYNKEHNEIYGFGEFSRAELMQQYKYLDAKKHFKENNKVVADSTQQKRGRLFVDIWRDMWNCKIEGQPVLCDIYALSALSQVFKDIKIFRGVEDDLRLHICSICPAGVGKSEGNDILSKFAKMVDLRFYSVDRYNDAVLTGSVNKDALQFNLKNRLKPDDPNYIKPYNLSLLSSNNFVVYDEGENILKTTSATEGAQRLLQKAMNRHGSEGNKITNTLVGFNIDTYPNCSVVITSYYLDEFKETLLRRGLLQRMIVYVQEEQEDLRTVIINRMINDIPSFDSDPGDAEIVRSKAQTKIADFEQELMKETVSLMDFHKSNDTKYVYIKKDAIDVLHECIDELRHIIPLSMGQQNVWESMVSRLTVNMIKISSIYALMNYRTYITREDASAAAEILIETMKSVAFFLSENVNTSNDKKTQQLYTQLRRVAIGQKMEYDSWVKLMTKKFGMSPKRAAAFVSNLEHSQKMKPIFVNNGSKKLLRLS